MASRATVATVAIFDVPALRPEHKNLLVGEPPQTRRFGPTCPEVVASLRSLYVTVSIAPVPFFCPAPHSPADNQYSL